jgi:hypothetical protein
VVWRWILWEELGRLEDYLFFVILTPHEVPNTIRLTRPIMAQEEKKRTYWFRNNKITAHTRPTKSRRSSFTIYNNVVTLRLSVPVYKSILLFRIWKLPVHLSAVTLIILIERFMVFLSPSRQIPFQFIIHNIQNIKIRTALVSGSAMNTVINYSQVFAATGLFDGAGISQSVQ